MDKETHLLEINLISAQGLKTPSANLRRMQTYALAWVEPSSKLRSRVDRVGGENPTWNDKFVFKVTSAFLSGETSAVSVEIYAVGCIRDPLVGSVRFLLGNRVSAASVGTPSLTAVQIRRPSGRFHGVLNIAASLVDGLGFTFPTGSAAICFRDLMREKERESRRRRRLSWRGSEKSEQSSGGESMEFSCGDSAEFSDGGDSNTSSSSATSTALKEWNGLRAELAGKIDLKSDGGGLLCGLMIQKKIHLPPSDPNWVMARFQEKKN